MKSTSHSYLFAGSLTAATSLAVCRPDDKFRSLELSETAGRLPRMGPKTESSPVYFPATTLRRLLRSNALTVVREALMHAEGTEHPFDLATHYMLVQGVDITNKTLSENSLGVVGADQGVRRANPLLSTFGRWKLASRLHVANAVPRCDVKDVVYVEGRGARHNDLVRNPENTAFLAPADIELLNQLLVDESRSAGAQDELRAQIKSLKVTLKKTVLTAEEKAATLAQIDGLNAQIARLKEDKVGSQETISRPLEGFEAIRQGTEMDHSMRLFNATELELGLILATLRAVAAWPVVGAHTNLGLGEIAGQYQITRLSRHSAKPESAGKVSFSLREGFACEGALLVDALARFDTIMQAPADHGLDFSRFMMEETEAA